MCWCALLVSCTQSLPQDPETLFEQSIKSSRDEQTIRVIEVDKDEVIYLEQEDREQALNKVQYIYPPAAISLNKLNLKTREKTLIQDLTQRKEVYLDSFEFKDEKYTVVADTKNLNKKLYKNWLKDDEQLITEINGHIHVFNSVMIVDESLYYIRHSRTNEMFELIHYDLEKEQENVIFTSKTYFYRIGDTVLYDSTKQKLLKLKDGVINEVAVNQKLTSGIETEDSIYLLGDDQNTYRFIFETQELIPVVNQSKIRMENKLKIDDESYLGINDQSQLVQFSFDGNKVNEIKVLQEGEVIDIQLFEDNLVITKTDKISLSSIK